MGRIGLVTAFCLALSLQGQTASVPSTSAPITVGTQSPISILPVDQRAGLTSPTGNYGSLVPPRRDESEEEPQILPFLPGPYQPSSDMLPPTEEGNYVNVHNKRDDNNNINGRILIPGVNWGWNGIIGGAPEEPRRFQGKYGECPGTLPMAPWQLTCPTVECQEDENCFGVRKCCRYNDCAFICVDPFGPQSPRRLPFTTSSTENNVFLHQLIPPITPGGRDYEKPGSCYRGSRGNNGYGNTYYRYRRQVPYDQNELHQGNGGGFGGGNNGNYNGGGFGGGNGGNGGYYPGTGGQQGGNYPGNGGQQGGNYPGNGYYPPPNNGGEHGGNNPGFGGGGNGGRYCYRDRDCPGNKKCCSRVCRTPAYVG